MRFTGKVRFNILLRPSLTVIFGFIGVLVVRSGTPNEIFAVSGRYFQVVAFLAFGTLGFLLPEIIELAGKAGIAALAKQIVRYLPAPKTVRRFPFRRGQKKPVYQNPLIIDTSVLIDGRLADIIKTGFTQGTFLVLPSVLGELHRLADSSDSLKRRRGRQGLEVLEALQADKSIKVEILNSEPKDKAVDDKLVKEAKKTGGKIITLDYNLNKVAKLRKVGVLNINELANALKTAVLPHERLNVQIKSVGRGKDQGIGYLEDGTMVVVEGGASLKGKNVEVVVHRVLQTAAGKMIFAKP